MNDDDLLFGLDDLRDWQVGHRPPQWLEERKEVLIARCKAKTAALEKLLTSAHPALAARLTKPI